MAADCLRRYYDPGVEGQHVLHPHKRVSDHQSSDDDDEQPTVTAPPLEKKSFSSWESFESYVRSYGRSSYQSGSTSWDSLWPQEEPTMRYWPLGADQAAADTFRLLPRYSGYLPRDLEQNAPNNMAKTEALAAGGRLYSAT
ncbi:hypothetical protein ATCC90586_012196 [Pythium insidiosum]|nr:hypothetical protein ATCC90586_012196 [Pythium insidiosum]